jgi:hypothetical protein
MVVKDINEFTAHFNMEQNTNICDVPFDSMREIEVTKVSQEEKEEGED